MGTTRQIRLAGVERDAVVKSAFCYSVTHDGATGMTRMSIPYSAKAYFKALASLYDV